MDKNRVFLYGVGRVASLGLAIAAIELPPWDGFFDKGNQAAFAVVATMATGIILQCLTLYFALKYIICCCTTHPGITPREICVITIEWILTTLLYSVSVGIFASSQNLHGSMEKSFNMLVAALVISIASGLSYILPPSFWLYLFCGIFCIRRKTLFVITGVLLITSLCLAIVAVELPHWARKIGEGASLGLFTFCDGGWCQIIPAEMRNDARKTVVAFVVMGIVFQFCTLIMYVARIFKIHRYLKRGFVAANCLTVVFYLMAVCIFGSPVGLKGLSGDWCRETCFNLLIASFIIVFVANVTGFRGEMDQWQSTPNNNQRTPSVQSVSYSVSVSKIAVRIPDSHVTIRMEKNDITKYRCDVMVMSGGVSESVCLAPESNEAFHKYKALVNSPRWLLNNQSQWETRLSSIVKDVLEAATKEGLRTIATVAIGCGPINRGDPKVGVPLIINTIINFAQTNPQSSLREVTLVENANETVINTAIDAIKKLQRRSQDPSRQSTDIPATWTAEDNVTVPVPNPSEEYGEVVAQFCATLQKKVVSIERVQNSMLFRQFMNQKHGVENRLRQEITSPTVTKNLFHGTSVEAAKSICQNGFDRSHAGKNGTAYGHGVYFASSAAYSNDFADLDSQNLRRIILAEVVVGEYCLGNRQMKVAPNNSDNNLPYDCVVNDDENPTKFVVFRDSSAYPKYVITYC